MFTGIVECIGIVKTLSSTENGTILTIADVEQILGDCRLGDSIAVNGTCLTVIEFGKDWFNVCISPETQRCTNMGALLPGTSKVNVERSMSAQGRFGGHLVQGHIDSICYVHKIASDAEALDLTFKLADHTLAKYIVKKGFITLDGISLTVTHTDDQAGLFDIMLIPHTQQCTVLASKKVGDQVNVEVDMIGKYVEKHMVYTYDHFKADRQSQ